MPRSITRKTLTPFGSTGPLASFGQFGSQAAGAAVRTKDPTVIQALAAWVAGWQNAVAAGNAPYLEDMNAVHFLMSYMQAYILQEGVAEWDSGTAYFIGSVVKAPGTFQLYGSLIDANLNNALPSFADNANWHYMGAATGSSANVSATPGTITQGTISTPDLRAQAVNTGQMADVAVTTPKLADASVTSAKIASGAVGPTKIDATAAYTVRALTVTDGFTIFPSGVILDFGGISTPSGWLPCDGSAVDRTTYAPLFAAIGIAWGPGNGVTTFNVPDLRRKTTVGSGGSATGILGNSVGNAGGEEAHLLTVSEMPSHAHGVSDPGHSHVKQFGAPGGSDNNFSMNPASGGAPSSTNSSGTGISIGATGGGGTHNVIQPSAVVLKIIKI